MSNNSPVFSFLLGSNGGTIMYFGKGNTLISNIRSLTYDNVDVDVIMTSIAQYSSPDFPNTRMKYTSGRYLGENSVTTINSGMLSLDDGREPLDVTLKFNNALSNAKTIFSTPLVFYQYLIGTMVNGNYYLPKNTHCYRLLDNKLISKYLCNHKNPNNTYTKFTRSVEYFDNPRDAILSTSLPNNSGFYYDGNSVSTCSNTYATGAYLTVLNDIGNNNNIITKCCILTEKISNRGIPIYNGYTLYVRSAQWQTIDGDSLQDVTLLFSELVKKALQNVGSPKNVNEVVTAWNVSDRPVTDVSTAVSNGDIVLNIDTDNYFNILTDISYGTVKALCIIFDIYPTYITPLNTSLTSLYPGYTF